MITAPFNFVPLSEKVFFPDWAEDVSHDVPFEDGHSGILDITITAKSPMFIRDHDHPEQFCQYGGEYYIPGSSVKGMIRNVLEIMSFSKMRQVDDNTYAVRDLSSAQNFYMQEMHKDVYCGWLTRTEDGHYQITDCGIPGRISHEEIDKATGKNFASKFKQTGFEKTSKFKYDILGQTHQVITVGELYRSKANPKYDKRLFCKFKQSGREGTLVVTGQPTPRKNTGRMGDGKGFEFVFFEPKETIPLKEETWKNFLFAYFDERDTQPVESPDWKFWKEKLEAGEKVPVFFQKNGKEIAHFGLSYLYKLPYRYSVKDGLPPLHRDERKDLAETIFGYIDDGQALKGRVQFSHFRATNKAQRLNPRTAILGTPRASYYPIYVKQQDGKLFKTFMDGDFSIAGWKRYPVHSSANVTKTTDTGNENVGTTFAPLKEGVVFQGKVRYHNLKKAELGALLSALTFHNTQGCFHTIGMAKPLGYGKIALSVNGIEIDAYLKAFELEVSEQVGNWAESDQIKELLTMATEQNNQGNSVLKHMELESFADHKSKEKDYLRNYTMLNGIEPVSPKSLIEPSEIEALRERQAKRKELEKLHQEEKRWEEQHRKEWEIVYASTKLSTVEAFVEKYPDSKYLKTAQAKIAEIKQKLAEEEQAKAEEEAKAKWEAVQHVEKKYYKKALEDYLARYGNSPYASEARQALEKLTGTTSSSPNTASMNFDQAHDAKSIERVMKSIQTPSEEDKHKLEEALRRIYPALNAKKKKQLERSKLIVRWLGKERFNDIIS